VPGERDLARMLASLDAERRVGTFVFVTGNWPDLRPVALATIEESEGTTYLVRTDDARRAGAPAELEMAWLTLRVWSALESVGLTAAVSRAMAERGIACNMLAGYHHDHLLVPADRADDAMLVVRGLSSR
jgi:hypothetical protein